MREFCLVGVGFLSSMGGGFVWDGGVFVLWGFCLRGFCHGPYISIGIAYSKRTLLGRISECPTIRARPSYMKSIFLLSKLANPRTMSSDNRCISYENLTRYNDWRAHIERSSYEIDQKVLLARNGFDRYTISHDKNKKMS